MSQSLELSSLGNLVKVGQGGQGVIYSAPNVKTTFSRSMVFKEYKPAVLAALDVDALTAMPEFLEENLTYREGATLISLAAWPCRVVEDNGQIKGFVMPAIPDHFFVELSTATGPTRVAAEFQHLLNDAHVLHMRFGDQVISDRQRYELLRHVASALTFLHGHGVCVGDMSPKNFLFSLSGTPEVYFIDCDAMRVHGVSLTEQLETPGWEIPHGEEKATIFSDRYKLGLLALRLILGSQDAKDPTRLPTDIPATLRQIITDTLTLPPDQRPTLTAWDVALDKAILATPQPPPPTPPWPPLLSTPTPTPTPTPQGTAGVVSSSADGPLYHPAAVALAGAGLLLVVLVIARAGHGLSESPSSTATSSSTTAAYPTTSEYSYTSSPTQATAPTTTTLAYHPPGVTGPDPNGDLCDGGWHLNDSYGRTDISLTHSLRGSQSTSCVLAANVLNAYWAMYSTPVVGGNSRTVWADGSVRCDSVPSARCDVSGRRFEMVCSRPDLHEGYADWVECVGGRSARVYLY